MTLSLFAAFVVAATLGAMVPGTTTALVIRQSAAQGTRSVIPLVLGVEGGLYAWIAASAFGVAALVATSSTAFNVLRVAGAAILLWLGIQAWRASWRIGDEDPVAPMKDVPARPWKAAVTGAVTQLSNPKVAVFVVAFFPQFAPANDDALVTTLVLGLIQICIDGGWYLLLALFVGHARHWLAQGRIRRRLERLTGTVFIALGLRMALVAQP
jgi:threonine/homoserine/homoserine lactone efflux protein